MLDNLRLANLRAMANVIIGYSTDRHGSKIWSWFPREPNTPYIIKEYSLNHNMNPYII